MSKTQLTREQAIELYESGKWKGWTDQQIVEFQLYQDCLAVPFGTFHRAVEQVLGRSVWSHEFAEPEHLRREFEKVGD